jgi:hypothetical protein
MTDDLQDMTQKSHVSIFPNITRDMRGRVERQRLVVVIDVIPNGNDYRLDVVTETISKPMIKRSHPVLEP